MSVFAATIRNASLSLFLLGSALFAQVDYNGDTPWGHRAEAGPDASVPGWFYNLGLTGLRAELIPDQPKALFIKYVFPRSPADGIVKIGDLIIGAGGQAFKEPHRNGYGEKVFGADGPILELALVLEACQSKEEMGKLPLTLRRGDKTVEVMLNVGQKYGAYSETYPALCPKSDAILAELLEYLVAHQESNGSFGDPVNDTFAPLALLASGNSKYLPALERNAKFHGTVTESKDLYLVNWSYTSAAIVLSEYYLATRAEWVIPRLQKIHDLLAKGQYLKMSQINPKARETHPDSFPKGPRDSHGGWGHNPGFEGYGPIAMLTGQGALAYSLMHRCGIKIDRKKLDAAYDFIKRGTGENGYVWYGDQVGGGPENWADMGRTGAAGIANFLSPYPEAVYHERALSHARVIGFHPESFPDTHGSPPMGMAFAALAAKIDPGSFRKLLDANRWWFTMAQCTDGSFYYQPNRDNAGYGSDSRTTISAVVAFIFSIPKQSLVITGKPVSDAVTTERETQWLTYPGGDGPGKGQRIVLIAADQEYRSEQSMPMMAKILSSHHGFDCTVLFGVNERGEVDPTMPVYPEKGKEAAFKEHHIPGLEHLASADLVIFFTRLLTLPQSELEQIVKYVDSGKPIMALRTANHGFRSPLPYKIDGKQVRWGEDILGGTFLNHHGRWHADSTRGIFDKEQTKHPILTGVSDVWGDSDVYRTYKEGTSLPPGCTPLVWGQPLMGRRPDDPLNEKLEPLPVVWVKSWRTSSGKTAQVFHSTMGSGMDLKNPGLRRLLINAVYWGAGMEASITDTNSVEIIGTYEPLESGFNYEDLGVKPRPVSYYR